MEWKITEAGYFELWNGPAPVLSAYSTAEHTDGRQIDTRTAQLSGTHTEADSTELVFTAGNGLILTERLDVTPDGIPFASCSLSETGGKSVESRRLSPLIMQAPTQGISRLWRSLWSQMLLVPYDNTMWLRYEAVPPRAGRRSYDLTVLFSPDSREGLLIGAVDFTIWKNALISSGSDAGKLEARCGIAEEGTHDSAAHGSMIGNTVSSSRFCIFQGEDYRKLLEQYGDLLKTLKKPLSWNGSVPFGFNSWAGLAFELNADNFRDTAAFMREQLMPAGYLNDGITYANLDAGWNIIPDKILEEMVIQLHQNGQRAGIYDAPFAFFGQDTEAEIPGVPGHLYSEILLRNTEGEFLPRVDGAIPYDVTHPVWKEQMRWKLQRFIDWGFDYIKLDFLSHGGMEGCHFDDAIRTGRQAITEGYEFLTENLSEDKIGRPFFISLSIAPLFPFGYGHARRFSCDAFGTAEDVEYVLNAQTYAWWQSGRLYAANDPDHICLLKSFCMEKDSTPGEARARYTTAVMAGTVMMLSDDFRREEARQRALEFASNREINCLAASGCVFIPVESCGFSASNIFTAQKDGKQYAAVFHWKKGKEQVCVDLKRAGLHTSSSFRELWSGQILHPENGILTWPVQDCDAVLLEEILPPDISVSDSL